MGTLLLIACPTAVAPGPDGASGSDAGATGVDAVHADGAAHDVAAPDLSAPDAATPDTATADAHLPDAHTPDAHQPDSSAADAGAPPLSARDTILSGVSQIQLDLSMSRVEADRAVFEPLVWASARATGGDKLGLVGTLPSPGWVAEIDAGKVVVWAGHESAFGADGDGVADNDRFRQNLLSWLLDGGDVLSFATTHGEWLRHDGLSPLLASWMSGQGSVVQDLGSALDAAALGGVDALVLGNPWGTISDAELDALELWVRGGGALLVLGLGWSWYAYHDDPDGALYPVNRIGARFGFKVMNGSIHDPAAPGGTPGFPAYPVLPLDSYQPAAVVVLHRGVDDVNLVHSMAAAAPADLFVIEGQHMGLQLPTADWASLLDPAAAIDAFDLIYLAQMELVQQANAPFGGESVWVVASDDPDAPWWMHSGNPIVYQAAAAQAEIIPRLNTEGHPGWGIPHEQGHNMHGDACGNLYVVDGTAESWTNVFTLWSYRQNSWDYLPQMGSGIFDVGHAYHAEAAPDFAQLLSDPWILLGCLELVWTRHGWEGMQTFMTQAAADTAAGVQGGDDAARSAYFVEQLSHAYQLDLAPLIAHWGFSVSAASAAVTSAYPVSDITW